LSNLQNLAKNANFSDLDPSQKVQKTPILVKNGQKRGLKSQEGMGQIGRLTFRECVSLKGEA